MSNFVLSEFKLNPNYSPLYVMDMVNEILRQSGSDLLFIELGHDPKQVRRCEDFDTIQDWTDWSLVDTSK